MDRDGAGFLQINEYFFVNYQIRQLMRDEIFNDKLNCLEQSAGTFYKDVILIFFGK